MQTSNYACGSNVSPHCQARPWTPPARPTLHHQHTNAKQQSCRAQISPDRLALSMRAQQRRSSRPKLCATRQQIREDAKTTRRHSLAAARTSPPNAAQHRRATWRASVARPLRRAAQSPPMMGTTSAGSKVRNIGHRTEAAAARRASCATCTSQLVALLVPALRACEARLGHLQSCAVTPQHRRR